MDSAIYSSNISLKLLSLILFVDGNLRDLTNKMSDSLSTLGRRQTNVVAILFLLALTVFSICSEFKAFLVTCRNESIILCLHLLLLHDVISISQSKRTLQNVNGIRTIRTQDYSDQNNSAQDNSDHV